MTTFGKQLFLMLVMAALSLLAVSCTDNRPPKPILRAPSRESVINTTQAVSLVADVRFRELSTSILNMVVKGGALYLTGRPFGYSRWDVSADPENPILTTAASDRIDQFSPDPPFGAWVVDYYASGGIGIFGQYVLTSGTAGTSVINQASAANPVEAARFPGLNKGQPTFDPQFAYTAMVAHPRLPIIYGFSQQEYLYTLNASALPNLQVVSRSPYAPNGGTVCCAESATVFGGRLFVAMRSRLWIYDFGNDGSLQNGLEMTDLQAVNVASTDRFLYVHHRATVNSTRALQTGIYVFDLNGAYVAYLPLNPLVFAVSPADTDIYANDDDTTVNIYRINN